MPEATDPLLRRGRPADPAFAPDERLFRRLSPRAFEQGLICDAAIPFPAFSVNREKYSEAEDVRQGHPDHGIFAFEVRAIPDQVEGSPYHFGVEHVPEEDNYSHSEVRTYLEGQPSEREPPKSVRKLFRQRLLASCTLIAPPATP